MLESNVIRVRKKSKGFTQVYNTPIQEDLRDLNAIGLLTYILSLPDDWTIRKTHLHKHFTRRTVDNAWKKLVETGYAIDFSFNVKGKKGKVYIYQVSDEKYTEDEFNSIVEETIKAYNDAGYTVNLDTVDSNNSFDVRFVQYNLNSTNRTPTNKHITNKDKQINVLTIVNKETQTTTENHTEKHSEQNVITLDEKVKAKKSLTDICNKYYTEFSINRWNKKQWNTLINKYVTEFIEAGKHTEIPVHKWDSYAYNSLENIAYSHDKKHGKIDFNVDDTGNESVYYNWLNDDGDDTTE